MSGTSTDFAELRRAVAEHPGWYHTLELPGGVVTPGVYDLRPFAPRALPDDLTGARVLDVGTFDGFWAFELERRGAVVVTLDLPDGTQADWPPDTRAANLAEAELTGELWGRGFEIAAAALGSSVRRVRRDVYDLVREDVGAPVDVVHCGTLLQHLQRPVEALERMRAVLRPGGELRMMESASISLTRRHPRRAVAEFRPGVPGSRFTWWMPNVAALRAWAACAGFEPHPGEPHRPPRHRVSGQGRDDTLISLRFRNPKEGQTPCRAGARHGV